VATLFRSIRTSSAIGLLLAATALAAAGGGSAATAATPTAITGPVTSVGPTTATATGTVNPNGQATTWWVEYGTSTSYGSKTSNVNAGSGTGNGAVSASLTSLAAGTTYHYRVVASNAAGTARGSDGIFTTSAAPVAVTGAATSVTPTSATLNGSVDPNGRATTWYFEYGASTSYGTKTAVKDAGSGGSASGVSAGVASLARGRLYHYRLVATSDAGTSRGADQTFSTVGAPSVATDAPSSIAPSAAHLNGRVTPNGAASSWYFEYGTTTRYGSRTPTRNAGSSTNAVRVSFSLTGLRRTTTYHYRLVATNASGTTAGSNRFFTTSLAPAVRTGAAQGVGTTTATLTGTTDPRGRATTWWFEYGTTTRYGSRTPARGAGSGVVTRTVTAAVTGLAAGETYHFRLVAKSDAGTSYGGDATLATVGVTLVAPARNVVYGRGIMLSGVVPTRRGGENVTLLAQAFGQSAFRSVVTIITAADGSWRYLAKPQIQTAYAASWNHGQSAQQIVAVRPAIALRRTATGRFSTRVTGARSFAGRLVQLQRRTAAGRWVTVKRVRLNLRSARLFRATLPHGTSRLRIAMSVNQAGAGYLAGFSRTIVFRRA
jgi:hypothetical protein